MQPEKKNEKLNQNEERKMWIISLQLMQYRLINTNLQLLEQFEYVIFFNF